MARSNVVFSRAVHKFSFFLTYLVLQISSCGGGVHRPVQRCVRSRVCGAVVPSIRLTHQLPATSARRMLSTRSLTGGGNSTRPFCRRVVALAFVKKRWPTKIPATAPPTECGNQPLEAPWWRYEPSCRSRGWISSVDLHAPVTDGIKCRQELLARNAVTSIDSVSAVPYFSSAVNDI